MTGKLYYLFLCMATYLMTYYSEKDWMPVAKRCWQWTKNRWDEGWDHCSVVVSEFLFEFDSYEETNKKSFDGKLCQADDSKLKNLFSGLPLETKTMKNQSNADDADPFQQWMHESGLRLCQQFNYVDFR